jgi:hypothetical protein
MISRPQMSRVARRRNQSRDQIGDLQMACRPSRKIDMQDAKWLKSVPKFTFDRTVADVFDDMVVRSVPRYDELQRMIVEMAVRFV